MNAELRSLADQLMHDLINISAKALASEEWTAWRKWHSVHGEQLAVLLEAALYEIDRLRDALKVYADEENWGSYHIHEADDPTYSLDVWVHAPSESYGPSVAKLALGEED